MPTRRHVIVSAAAVLTSTALARPACAQGAKFPDRPIKIVVPFAAGGGVDVYARLLADKITQQTGAAIVIDNRAGANGTVGGNAVRTSDADGHTVLFSASTHVMARHVMKAAPYDPLADFAQIARVGEAPMLLVMAPNTAPKTVGELATAMKLEPTKWTFGIAALGAAGHLATVAFNQTVAASPTVVTYRGTAPALNDVAGGHIQLLIDPVLALLPMAQEKKVRGLAVTTAKRTKLAPDIPTLAESGLAGFDHASWYGLWGPKGLPPALVGTLNSMFNNAVKALDAEGRLAKLGIEAVTETPAAFAAFATSYSNHNGEALKAAKFEPV